MNVIFDDDALKDLYEKGRTESGKYKKLCRDRRFIEAYIRVVDVMLNTETAAGLKNFSFLHYEQLKHRPESSVRIMNNRVERLVFNELDDGIEVKLIEIDAKHYGKKR